MRTWHMVVQVLPTAKSVLCAVGCLGDLGLRLGAGSASWPGGRSSDQAPWLPCNMWPCWHCIGGAHLASFHVSGLPAGGELDALSQLPSGDVAVNADLQILFVRFLADTALIRLPLDIKYALAHANHLNSARPRSLSTAVSTDQAAKA